MEFRVEEPPGRMRYEFEPSRLGYFLRLVSFAYVAALNRHSHYYGSSTPELDERAPTVLSALERVSEAGYGLNKRDP